MSRIVLFGAFLLAVAILVALYIYGQSTPALDRTSGTDAVTSTAPEPPPVPATGPVDTDETAGAAHGAPQPPPQ